jgi:hypothetical protein
MRRRASLPAQEPVVSQAEFSLPPAISWFIAALNRFDGDALIEPFTDDALVNDNHREFWGKAAIKKFADREFIGDKVTMAITDVRQHHSMFVVAAKVDGEYDKTNVPNPLILTFYFMLRAERITTLIIIHNKPAN